MKIITFDQKFKMRGFIYDYISLEYSEKYNEASDFEIVVPFTKNNLDILVPQGYVVLDTLPFVIDERIVKDGKITIRGESFLSIYKNVILEEPEFYDGNPYSNALVMLNKGDFEGIIVEVYSTTWNGGEYKSICPYNCSVYSQIINLAKIYNFGFKVFFFHEEKIIRIFIMEKYDKTIEKDGVMISDKFGNYYDCHYEFDISKYKNYAHVPYGYDADGEYVYVNVDWHKYGESIRAMTVNVPRMLSSAQLTTALTYEGELALAKHRKKETYKVALSSDVDLKTGEICTFENTKYNEKCNALVMERIIKETEGKHQVFLVLDKQE